MNSLDKSEKIKFSIFLFWCVLGLSYCIYSFFIPESILAFTVMNLLVYSSCIFYRLLGYKIKGTRLLKHTIILFVIILVIKAVSNKALDPNNMYLIYSSFLLSLSAVIAAYMSGRLVRVKENRFIIAIVLVLLIAYCFVRVLMENTFMLLDAFNIVVQWVLMSGSYLVRADYIQKMDLEDYKKEFFSKIS